MSSTWFFAAPPLILGLLSLIGLLGLIAVVSPSRFAQIARSGSHWVDTSHLAQAIERPIPIDQHVLRYSRVFGVAVVASAAWLAYVYVALCR